ncbi:MAG: transposase [Ktedonobacteraceae bacterium]|nr:transposase [Ktedonobacteraceae bacterium]
MKWRSFPHDYSAWETVYWYFKVWAEDGTIVRIHKKLRQITRVTAICFLKGDQQSNTDQQMSFRNC